MKMSHKQWFGWVSLFFVFGLFAGFGLGLAVAPSIIEGAGLGPRSDFQEGTPDSILFQMQKLAEWRELARVEREARELRLAGIMADREARAHAEECWGVARVERYQVNWKPRAWDWYNRECPRGAIR